MTEFINDIIQSLVGYLETNLYVAGLIVFLTAMLEAVFVVGFFVPSTAVLVGAGTLIGLGRLPFWEIFLLCTAGAAVGDQISYWIGATFKERLRTTWPFSQYAIILEKGEHFFRHHGAKSIAFGRFVPGIKAVIPGIAGMLSMDVWKFAIINVLSAFVWSAAHLLPGMAAGAALEALGEVSMRLAVVVGIVLALVFGAVLIARWLIIEVRPLIAGSHQRLIAWTAVRPGPVSQWFSRTFDPGNPRALGMLVASLLLMAATLGFLRTVTELRGGEEMVRWDVAVLHLMEGLRTPPGDRVMVLVTMLGDGWVLTVVGMAAIVALVLWHAWRRAIGLFTAIAAAATFVPLMKLAFDRQRPQEFQPHLEALSFPSGHATINVALYGILAVLIAHGWSIRAKALVFSAATAFVTAIALSRIYLNAHWPSDVIGGMLFGLAIVAAFAFVFGHLEREPIDQRRLGIVVLAMLALAGTTHFVLSYQQRLALYAPKTVVIAVPLDDWRRQQAPELPPYRVDLGGKASEPIVLQWAGPADSLRTALQAKGWRLPPDWSIATVGDFARGDARSEELPVLPRFHDGRDPLLTLIEPIDSAGRWVLRIWDSGLTVQGLPAGSDGRLLVGSIVAERLRHPLGQLTVTAIDRSAIYHAATLAEMLPGATLVQRTAGASATGAAAAYVVLGP